jgi:pimeloyl-ACP methyl ester carboxylesterase
MAERLFLTVPRPAPPAREELWAAGARRLEVPSPAGPLAAWQWGSGPRIALLVHGWAGRGLQLGGLAGPLVAQGFRVVTFDAPGHGASGGRTSSLPEMAAGLEAVAQHAGPVDAVVAHSLGTLAAMVAMARGGLRPRAVVAVAPPARLDAIGQRFSQLTGFSAAVVERMRKRIEERLAFSWDDHEPLRLAPLMGASLAVIHDHDDREVPFAEGAALASSWPAGRVLATTGLGHRRVLRSDSVAEATAAFLAGSEDPLPAVTGHPAAVCTLSQPTKSLGGRAVQRLATAWQRLCSAPWLAVDLGAGALSESDIAVDLAYGRD